VTFSIVGHEPGTGAWGVAVASKFIAAGGVVPYVAVGGAIATQSYANLAYGPQGLALSAAGVPAEEIVAELTGPDTQRELRQVGVVDGDGNAATFTGTDCFDWAGGLCGDGYACQGNTLVGETVVRSAAETFETTGGDLATRLVAALLAGDRAGGDRRGRQAAAVVVAQADAGYGAGSDIAVDLRVDDHPRAAEELERILGLHELVFPRPGTLSFVELTDGLAAEVRTLLASRGIDIAPDGGYDEDLNAALFEWAGMENLEERLAEGARIETRVLAALRGPSR